MSEAIPSNEEILKNVTHHAMTSSQLRDHFGITKKFKLTFKAVLADLVEQGVLGRNAQKQYVPAQVQKGYNPDTPVYDGSPGARRRKQELVQDDGSKVRKGILLQEGEEWAVRDASNQKIHRLPNRKGFTGKVGQTVVFELYPHPKHRFEMLAKIVANLESYGSFQEIKDGFHHNFDLPPEFPPEVESEIKPMGEPTDLDFKGRVDHRDVRILCIDPLGARDHDDAVSVEHLPGGGFRLGVHIADVSHYVKEGGPLDNEAVERAFTQYLPWCAVPMLPEKLSAELCSLNEGVDRLAFTCMMQLDAAAKVKSWEFYRSVINVTRSVTYEQAMEMYEQKDEEVIDMAKVARLLKADRKKSGLLELNSPEYKVDFDEKKEPCGVSPRSSVESNSWIEECMLIANQCCAKELVKRGLQGIFRIHESPDLADIIELAQAEPELVRGAPVAIKDLPPSKQGDTNLSPDVFRLYLYMVEKAAGIDPKIFKILRSMQKAHYDSNAFGHFALNWQDYAHFTSPIRRYADLWCHRELARTGKEIKAQRGHDVVEVCELISANEIKNQKCERTALKVCAAWILREHVGDIFEGTINGMEEWGLFVTLSNPPCDGLVRFRDLPGDDYWFFNRERGCIVGRRSRKTFWRGDKVEVQVLRVNPPKGEIDLAITAKLESSKPARDNATGEEKGSDRLAHRDIGKADIPWDALSKKPHRSPWGNPPERGAGEGRAAAPHRSPWGGPEGGAGGGRGVRASRDEKPARGGAGGGRGPGPKPGAKTGGSRAPKPGWGEGVPPKVGGFSPPPKALKRRGR
jgi:ribonuclease R